MKNVKYIIWIVGVLLIAWVSYLYFWLNSVLANPDYICIKSVPNPVCTITSCDERNTNTHKRTCYWKKVLEVWYYHTRTTCESGYKWIRWGWYTSWASWRKSSDFAWSAESCQIEEIDNENPIWEVEQILDSWETVDTDVK